MWHGVETLMMIIVDFRVNPNTVCIIGEEGEVVEENESFGVHLNTRLDWRLKSEAIYNKGQSRLYFQRKHRFFKVGSKIQIFYECVLESIILSAIIYWGSSIRTRDLKRLNSLMKKVDSCTVTLQSE